MSWVSVSVAAVSAGVSGYKAIKAAQQDKAAAREGAALRRPFYQIPSEYEENKNLYKQEAGQGLTAAEKSYAGEQRERGFASSIEATEETGGGPNSVSSLNRVFNDSLKSQSALDAQQHIQNIQLFTKANQDLAGQKATQFGINELQPYETKLKEIQDRRIAAKTNENNAINEGIGALGAGATGVNSFMKTNPGATAEGPQVNATPYNRTFGLADTGGGGFNSPAAGIQTIDPGSLSPGAMASLPDTSDNY